MASGPLEKGIAHLSGDRLIDLVQGAASSEQREADLAHLRRCPDCESRLRNLCLESVILDLGLPPHTIQPRRPSIPWRFVGAACAGTAVLGLFAFIYAISPKRVDGLDYRLPVQSEPLVLRSLPAGAESASLLAAVDAYGRGDFSHVVELLNDRELRGNLDFLNLFHASALVWTGHERDAEIVLDRLTIDTLPRPYRDRARRVQYVALRRDHKDAEADRILRGLANEDGEFAEWARGELTRVQGHPSE